MMGTQIALEYMVREHQNDLLREAQEARQAQRARAAARHGRRAEALLSRRSAAQMPAALAAVFGRWLAEASPRPPA